MLRREREERERLARELESQTLSGFARWVFVLFLFEARDKDE